MGEGEEVGDGGQDGCSGRNTELIGLNCLND